MRDAFCLVQKRGQNEKETDGEKLTFDYMGLGLDMTADDLKKKPGEPYSEKENFMVFKKGSNDIMVRSAKDGKVREIIIYTENALAKKLQGSSTGAG